jgi:tol-pal system protein YbgF
MPVRTSAPVSIVTATIIVLPLVGALLHPALAQDRPGFLDNLFNRGDQRQDAPAQPPQGQGQVAQGQPGPAAGGDPNDLGVRIDRIESALRQLTGTVEQLTYRNQQLEQQVRALQGGNAATPPQQPGQQPVVRPGVPGALTPSQPSGRRSDVFDPSQNPDAPGAPRTLGNASVPMDTGVGAPNGRAAGAPLDLSTLAGNAARVPAESMPAAPVSNAEPVTAAPMPGAPRNAPTAPPRNVAAPAAAAPTRLATLPPSAKPQDEYDLAYGYVLHKDYALAEQAFRDFLKKYPDENLVPDAQYWLGESLYQRQRYRDAAESFLTVSDKYKTAGKAPNALLRLGQSLVALHQKEAACATLNEVGRKYPKASASVKRGVTEELKRAHC